MPRIFIQWEDTPEYRDRVNACADAEGLSVKSFIKGILDPVLATYPSNDVLRRLRNMKFHKRYPPEMLDRMIAEAVPPPPSSERGIIKMVRGKRGK
jgi:hypothetical protein